MNKKPTRRDISKILGRPFIDGFNDKRTFGNRIKLRELLSVHQSVILQKKLRHQFPDCRITVYTHMWKSAMCHSVIPVTAIAITIVG